MGEQTKPRLGEWVLFTHYYEAPTQAECEARCAEDESTETTIFRARRVNPEPDKPALVAGAVSRSEEAQVSYLCSIDGEDEIYRLNWDYGKNRTYYVLRRTLRGRRYLVKAEDIRQRLGGEG